MSEQPKEYSLAELLEHPGLCLVMTDDGIERRCLELILDLPSGNRPEEDSAGDKTTGYGV
jgi:hypothetical protein